MARRPSQYSRDEQVPELVAVSPARAEPDDLALEQRHRSPGSSFFRNGRRRVP